MWAIDNLNKHAKYKEEEKERLIKAWIFENVFKRLVLIYGNTLQQLIQVRD